MPNDGQARDLLCRDGDDLTLREFLDRHRVTAHFRRHFMEPLVASVWSCDPAMALDDPAHYLCGSSCRMPEPVGRGQRRRLTE